MDGLGPQLSQRRQLYSSPVSKLRLLMISRMAKPEEVIVVEDENGNIVRETMKDNDVLVQYKVWSIFCLYTLMMCLQILFLFYSFQWPFYPTELLSLSVLPALILIEHDYEMHVYYSS